MLVKYEQFAFKIRKLDTSIESKENVSELHPKSRKTYSAIFSLMHISETTY